MNGIDFILRDRTGWTPSVPAPRRRLRWATPKREAMRPEEVAFIKGARGRLTAKELADCYSVSAQTISNIWSGRCPAVPVHRPIPVRPKRK
ncbi:hypothetical protein [Achromobacter animicus]|uniref:hypothetical protein n=1 Tax=Achromobacter animicus TaxID=1389935 RepID=UPI0028A81DD9|nr:hypothetical protein [Achromobacter animicus]